MGSTNRQETVWAGADALPQGVRTGNPDRTNAVRQPLCHTAVTLHSLIPTLSDNNQLYFTLQASDLET